jgi:hypothetical protein
MHSYRDAQTGRHTWQFRSDIYHNASSTIITPVRIRRRQTPPYKIFENKDIYYYHYSFPCYKYLPLLLQQIKEMGI